MKCNIVRLAGYGLMFFLLSSNTCVTIVSDKKNRKEEINNTAQSLGEHVLWKKLEKTKEVIDHTYTKIHALQDSIEQAKYLVHSVVNMKMASIESELLEINDIKLDVNAYLSGIPDNAYGAQLKMLYQNNDVDHAAQQLADMLYFTDHLPKETGALEELIAGTGNFRMYYCEFADKRAMQASRTYRKWAKLYREKGAELSGRVLEDKSFAMSDYERINLQRMAQKYTVMSYEFIEKSDSILLAINENKDPIKVSQQRQVGQYLFAKQLFE